jgi:hypothetical protein
MEHEDIDPSLTIADLFTHLVAESDAIAVREEFCDVVASQLRHIAGWLAVDAWLGFGDIQDTSVVTPEAMETARDRSFVAVGLVAQISSALMEGALLLFRNGNEYAASALLRQLIECEYLLRAFRLNFADAARWHDAYDSNRWDFQPKALRKIGGFDDREYAAHCETGGHPNRAGRPLLDLERAIAQPESAISEGENDLDAIQALLWLDFTMHCERTWSALTDLLSAQHARFDVVRRDAVDKVATSRATWLRSDTLARHAGPLLRALSVNPDAPLTELLAKD